MHVKQRWEEVWDDEWKITDHIRWLLLTTWLYDLENAGSRPMEGAKKAGRVHPLSTGTHQCDKEHHYGTVIRRAHWQKDTAQPRRRSAADRRGPALAACSTTVFTCLSLCDEEVYLAPAASACRASAGVGSVNGYPSPVDGWASS
jgi:hypothetical protein